MTVATDKFSYKSLRDHDKRHSRNQYSLGFSPDQQAAEVGYHKVAVQLKKKDLTVQARDGYYAAE